jgi:hypothetical protein
VSDRRLGARVGDGEDGVDTETVRNTVVVSVADIDLEIWEEKGCSWCQVDAADLGLGGPAG